MQESHFSIALLSYLYFCRWCGVLYDRSYRWDTVSMHGHQIHLSKFVPLEEIVAHYTDVRVNKIVSLVWPAVGISVQLTLIMIMYERPFRTQFVLVFTRPKDIFILRTCKHILYPYISAKCHVQTEVVKSTLSPCSCDLKAVWTRGHFKLQFKITSLFVSSSCC